MKIHRRSILLGAGVLVVVAMLAKSVTCGSGPARPEHAVVSRQLALRGFQQVRDTDVFRAHLMDNSGGYSSYGRIRNILFVEPSGAARWLLPDDEHVIEEHAVSPTRGDRWVPEPERSAVAIVALAKPLQGSTDEGTLYLLDPAGRKVVVIADHVRGVYGTALSAQGVALMYERSGRYFLAHYDVATLTNVREVEVAVPALKSGGPTTR